MMPEKRTVLNQTADEIEGSAKLTAEIARLRSALRAVHEVASDEKIPPRIGLNAIRAICNDGLRG